MSEEASTQSPANAHQTLDDLTNLGRVAKTDMGEAHLNVAGGGDGQTSAVDVLGTIQQGSETLSSTAIQQGLTPAGTPIAGGAGRG